MFTWDAAVLLGVLGDPLRLRVVGQIAPLAGESITLSRLAARLGEPTDRIRDAVAPLEEVGLLLVERSGRATRYRADGLLLASLLDYLARRIAPVGATSGPAPKAPRQRPRSLLAALASPDMAPERTSSLLETTASAMESLPGDDAGPVRIRVRARTRPHGEISALPANLPTASAGKLAPGGDRNPMGAGKRKHGPFAREPLREPLGLPRAPTSGRPRTGSDRPTPQPLA